MSDINYEKLYDWLVATIEESSSSVLAKSDDFLEAILLEDFDIDAGTVLHKDSLNLLLHHKFINTEIFKLAEELGQHVDSLRGTPIWSLEAVRSGNSEWKKVISLSDHLMELLRSTDASL